MSKVPKGLPLFSNDFSSIKGSSPARLTLKTQDGIELKDVTVSVWKTPNNRFSRFFFDITTWVVGIFSRKNWEHYALKDKSILWVNKETLARAKYNAILTGLSDKDINEKQQDKIAKFLRSQTATSLKLQLKNQEFIQLKKTSGELKVKVYKKLDAGGFKTVYKVNEIFKGRVYAKALQKESAQNRLFGQQLQEEMKKEFKICQQICQEIGGEGIIKMHKITSPDKETFGISMEFCEKGDLLSYFNGFLNSVDFLKTILPHYLSAGKTLAKMHEKGHVHGDVKLENIMLTGSLETRIIDFGFTGKVGEKVIGTTHQSPELLEGKTIVLSTKQDAWSFGAILFMAATREDFPSFQLDDKNNTVQQQIEALLTKIPSNPPYGDELKKIITSLLQYDPQKRADIKDILPQLEGVLTTLNQPESQTTSEVS